MFQLINSDEILFCLFDKKSENLDSFGFALNKDELSSILLEVESVFEVTSNKNLENHIKEFSLASKIVNSSFNNNGLPKSRSALDI